MIGRSFWVTVAIRLRLGSRRGGNVGALRATALSGSRSASALTPISCFLLISRPCLPGATGALARLRGHSYLARLRGHSYLIVFPFIANLPRWPEQVAKPSADWYITSSTAATCGGGIRRRVYWPKRATPEGWVHPAHLAQVAAGMRTFATRCCRGSING